MFMHVQFRSCFHFSIKLLLVSLKRLQKVMWQQVLNNMLQVKISQQISVIHFPLYGLFCRFSCFMIFKVQKFLGNGFNL